MILRWLTPYIELTRFNKPIGILLLLWPTLWALLIAGQGHPDLFVTTVFILGVVVMRSAGCIINDIADRHVDGYVTRTQSRPSAMVLFVVLCGVALGLVLTLNRLTILLSIPAVLLAVSYPFMKRITHLPQLVLGLAFSWSIPMAFAAQLQQVPTLAWVLMGANLSWVVVYDTLYAMVDRDDDLKIGIKSTAILFGSYDRLILGCLHLVSLGLLSGIGWIERLRWPYWVALGCALLLIIHQQIQTRHRQPTACFRAFLNNNWYGLVITIGFWLGYTNPLPFIH